MLVKTVFTSSLALLIHSSNLRWIISIVSGPFDNVSSWRLTTSVLNKYQIKIRIILHCSNTIYKFRVFTSLDRRFFLTTNTFEFALFCHQRDYCRLCAIKSIEENDKITICKFAPVSSSSFFIISIPCSIFLISRLCNLK